MSIRQALRPLHHRAIDAGLGAGLLDGVKTLTVGGVSADFHVGSWHEWQRATDAMGERKACALVLDALGPGAVLWDIGAAVGTYSCLASQTAADVVAIEPHSGAAERLRDNARLNDAGDRIDVRELALSDDDGEGHLNAQPATAGGSHALAEDGQPVAMCRGDQLHAPAPDVIKIDVEGHEGAVLRGLGDRLTDAAFVLVESHTDGPPVVRLRTRLGAAGFDVETVGDRDGETFLAGVAGGGGQ